MPRAKVNLIGELNNRRQVYIMVDKSTRYNTQIQRSGYSYILMPDTPGAHVFSIFENDFYFGERNTRLIGNIVANFTANSVITINIIYTMYGVTDITYSVKEDEEPDPASSSYSGSSSYYDSDTSYSCHSMPGWLKTLWEGIKWILKIFGIAIAALVLITLIGMGCEHFQLL